MCSLEPFVAPPQPVITEPLTLPLRTGPSGYLYVTLGSGDWLLDTGAPRTFGEPKEISIKPGLSFRILSNLMGCKASTVREYVTDVKFVGLLGCDVLALFDTTVDIGAGELVLEPLGTHVPSPDATPIQFVRQCGIPALDTNVKGQNLRMFLDTGALLTFMLPKHFTRKELSQPATHNDFHVTQGRFKTIKVGREVELTDGLSQSMACGVVPASLQPCFEMSNCDGILGQTVFHNRRVTFANGQDCLFLSASKV